MHTKKDFLHVVKCAPLVSIDLIVKNQEDEVLLGRRNNEPARGFLFVPGGRILKNERLPAAFARIAQTELNRSLKWEEAAFLGVYEHLYDTNAFGAKAISTHYIVLAYVINIFKEQIQPNDPQHSELIWVPVRKIVDDPKVHLNTQIYFR